MGTGTLTDRASGQVILDTFWNDIHDALNGDFVGRNSSGVATTSQNLGTNALPWGSLYTDSIILNGSAVDASLLTAPVNRIVSGAVRSASNQPQFITPNGSAASLIINGGTTDLVLDINGTAVTVNTDITISSLTVGPSTTATCLVDDADASADENFTKSWGEYNAHKDTITVDNMGAEMQTFIGQYQWIKVAGASTGYAFGLIKSTTVLSNMYRGYGTDSSGAPVNRVAFTNNDTLTVLSTAWVFVENNGTTTDVSYTTPIRSFTSPTSPSTADYWYDMANQVWKRYDGASWNIINRTLIGVVGIDSANCVIARSFDFHFNPENHINNVEIAINSTSIIEIKNQNAKINVYGTEYNFGYNKEIWNITSDLATSADMYTATEQASTEYFLYIKDTGDSVISDIGPFYRPDLGGVRLHPHNPWRCVGQAWNDSGSDLKCVAFAGHNTEVKSQEITVVDQQTSGTAGGGSAAADYQTRVLNTIVGIEQELVYLLSNAIYALSGIWKVSFSAPNFAASTSKAFFYDNTNSSVIISGSSEYADAGGTSFAATNGSGVAYLNPTYAHILRHYTGAAKATTGLGVATSSGDVERFGKVVLEKIW